MYRILIFFLALVLTFSLSCRKRKGCTDDCASNYNHARHDDGSCVYVKPVIDYISHLSDNCKPPYGVNFYTNVSNVSCDVNYEWNFGDGVTSTSRSPYHVFTQSGSYTITLKARNRDEETSSQIILLLDTNQSTVAEFGYGAENSNYRIPAKIKFYNYSNFAGSFLWDFGDGSTSTDENPIHEYTKSGNFIVTLKSFCGSRQATYSKTFQILSKPSTIALTHFNVIRGDYDLSSDKGTPLYLEMEYNNNSEMFSKIYLYKSYPAEWYFPRDIDNGSYKVYDTFFGNDFFSFNLWLDELGATDKLLHYGTVDFTYLSNNYYPRIVKWDAGGYKMEATLEYN